MNFLSKAWRSAIVTGAFAAATLGAGDAGRCAAADSKTAPAEPPHVTLCLPLAVTPGVATKLIVRGLRLSEATEVRIGDGVAKIFSKGAATVPDKYDAKRVGDQQVEVEWTAPGDSPAETVELVVTTPAGRSTPHRLMVGGRHPRVEEKEPNDGFRQAQPLIAPRVVDGTIHANQNVDVYALELAAGARLRAELFAARHGSTLDGLLHLYDAAGALVGSADDAGDTRDARLETTVAASGVYYLTVFDAHDRGSPLHVYRLVVER